MSKIFNAKNMFIKTLNASNIKLNDDFNRIKHNIEITARNRETIYEHDNSISPELEKKLEDLGFIVNQNHHQLSQIIATVSWESETV